MSSLPKAFASLISPQTLGAMATSANRAMKVMKEMKKKPTKEEIEKKKKEKKEKAPPMKAMRVKKEKVPPTKEEIEKKEKEQKEKKERGKKTAAMYKILRDCAWKLGEATRVKRESEEMNGGIAEMMYIEFWVARQDTYEKYHKLHDRALREEFGALPSAPK